MAHKTIILLFLLSLPSFVSASVVINEIAWMGTESSYNNEWIELKNLGNENISLDGWIIRAEDGSPEIKLEGEISTFYLIERTDDDSVPGIKADLFYKGALSNKGENLNLITPSGETIDKASFSDGWPAGDNKTKQTMERNNNSWQTSQEPGGTPRKENSQGVSEKKSSPQLSAEEKPSQTESYPKNIIFTEILPSPEGPDSEEEWIVPTKQQKVSECL